MTSNKMQQFKIEFTMIILICLNAITASEFLEIFRRKPAGDNGWKEGTDSFTIPPSLCQPGESSSVNCARFNARATSYSYDPQCRCSCSSDSATLLFTNSQWKCLKNSDVRDLLGYAFPRYTSFYQERKDNKLRMLDNSDERRINISPHLVKNCRVDNGSSSYVGCDRVDVPFNSSLFTIKEEGRIDAEGGIHNYLKVNGGESSTDFLRGRIIKLGIRCDFRISSTGSRHHYSRLLLFKYVGNVTCSKSQSYKQNSLSSLDTNPPHTISLPSTTLHVITATKTSSLVPSPIITVTIQTENAITSTSDIPPTVSDSPTTVSDSPAPTVSDSHLTVSDRQPIVTITPSTTFVSRRTVVVSPPKTSSRDNQPTVFSSKIPLQPSSGRGKISRNNSSLPSGLIAGIIGLVAVVFTVIIVGSLVYRHRNLNKASRSSTTSSRQTKKDSVIVSPQINPAYELDDQNMYRSLSFEEPPIYASYCKETQSSNADTEEEHYAPLNIQEDQNIYGHEHSQEVLYNVLENPVSEDEIIDENYESIVEGTVDDVAEPVYNVLEQPCIELESHDPECVNEPVYNIVGDEPNQSVRDEDDTFVTRDFVKTYLKNSSWNEMQQ